jgi:error-prone DNA polymerase
MTLPYAELQCVTNFSFLRGGSHGEELVARAEELGLEALAVADHNTVAGVVRAHLAAKQTGLKFIPAARLDLRDAPSLLAYPTDRPAWGRLTRLLTEGQRRAEKGDCELYLEDVAAHAEGLIFISPLPDTAGKAELRRLKEALSTLLYLAASHRYRSNDRARIAALDALGQDCGTPLVATGDVLYHAPERRPLQDVLTCIREKCTIAEAGLRLEANAERHLKAPAEMARLFAGFEEAVERTVEIADACRFSLDELVYEYPDEPVPEGRMPQGHLEDLTWEGARWRFPDGVPERIAALLKRELALIAQLRYAPYFLTVHDIVRFARSRGILCQGRGSAANSAVCYCLAITNVNPAEIDLLFERFISPERQEPPDIDVDFEHARREEVIQYIYARYGRERAALAATVISYRRRSAVREVGKAMGLSEDTVSALASTVWHSHSGGALPEKHVREAGLDPADPLLARTLVLAGELMGFPRHLSQHVGGFVLTRGPLSEVVPIANAAMEDRTVIEWDKDDLDALGLLKVDVLGLGMLTCIRKCFELIEAHYGRALTLAGVPRDDKATYDMLCRADSIGVFQVESRAQMNMLPRLRPRCFYDLVIEVAIVRPGPIQGDMVHPYLRRRDGIELEDYPSPAPEHGPLDELRQVLSRTKGVPLFQEQAMRIAMVAAKFSPEEANALRHSMATFRRRGTIETLRGKMVGRMIARGYDADFAERCFNQIKGFGEYGFPESHAASFAHLVYVSAWLKCHYPEVFACGLLNSQPMGFYAPAQIVRCAREHGVEAREVDVNRSQWDSTLEPSDRAHNPQKWEPVLRQDYAATKKGTWALRLGLRQVDGLKEADVEKIVAARTERSFRDAGEIMRRAGVSRSVLERLAAADAFRSLGLDRRQALWQVRALTDAPPLPLFDHARTRDTGVEPDVILPETPLSEHVVNDYQTLRLSLKAHPMRFLRPLCREGGAASCAEIGRMRDGQFVIAAGVVLVRQRPGSAKGVVFMTIEDETGIANIVIWSKTLERYRRVVMGSRLAWIRGRVQRHEDIIHVVANRLEDRSHWLSLLSEGGLEAGHLLANADEIRRPDPGSWRPGRRHPRAERIIPKSRDFH